MQNLAFEIGTWLIPLIVAIVFHEVAHGRTARFFGDMTAHNAGRLSLNPIRHIDPFGTILVPGLLAISGMPVFGWARPVPVRQSMLRNPRWHMVLVAAAGPASNILLAILAAFALALAAVHLPVLKEGGATDFLHRNLTNFIAVNLFLAVFNMLPLPPFDGSKVLAGFLPPRLGLKYQSLDRFALLFMLALLVGLPWLIPNANILERVVLPPVAWMFDVLNSIMQALVGGVPAPK